MVVAMKQQFVTYEDFPMMGLNLHPVWIRKMARLGKFPKPIKGSGIDGAKATGKAARFHWRKADVENYVAVRKSRQRRANECS